jgi:hypothetical protein
MDGKCLETIEGAVVMTRLGAEEFVRIPSRRFRWEAFLPKRKAWMQTLILLPFGLPVANFLGASWHFSVKAILEERQYLLGVLSMAINLLLPSLFFACLFQWIWLLLGKHESSTWYPKARALSAGAYATLTIAFSFGMVGLFTHSLGICGNSAWGNVAETLLCNLDGYAFESKSWFGAWFVIAAYCYQAQSSIHHSIEQRLHRSYPPRFSLPAAQPTDRRDLTSVAAANDDYTDRPIDPIGSDGED